MTVFAALDPGSAPVGLLYIVSFSLFIYGIRLGTHPTTARRGNGIAAIGMAIAVATTLALQGIGNWWVIIVGIAASSTTARDFDQSVVSELEGLALEENVVAWVLSKAKVADKPVAFDELMGSGA